MVHTFGLTTEKPATEERERENNFVARSLLSEFHIFTACVNENESEPFFIQFRFSSTTFTMSRPYDVVIFGASGFTGQFVVEHLAKALQREDGQVSWAVSGRSEAKLKQVLENASKVTALLDLMTVQIYSFTQYGRERSNLI